MPGGSHPPLKHVQPAPGEGVRHVEPDGAGAGAGAGAGGGGAGGGGDGGGSQPPLTHVHPGPGAGVEQPVAGGAVAPVPVVNAQNSDAATSDGLTSVANVREITRQ
jgi:hypothetical protein